MSNSNWDDTNLPRPPVPAPAAAPVSRRTEAVRELADEITIAAFAQQLEYADGCETCRAWLFGAGLQCEEHGWEG